MASFIHRFSDEDDDEESSIAENDVFDSDGAESVDIEENMRSNRNLDALRERDAVSDAFRDFNIHPSPEEEEEGFMIEGEEVRIYNDKRIELINLENVYAIIIPLDSLNDARPLLKCVQSFLVGTCTRGHRSYNSGVAPLRPTLNGEEPNPEEELARLEAQKPTFLCADFDDETVQIMFHCPCIEDRIRTYCHRIDDEQRKQRKRKSTHAAFVGEILQFCRKIMPQNSKSLFPLFKDHFQVHISDGRLCTKQNGNATRLDFALSDVDGCFEPRKMVRDPSIYENAPFDEFWGMIIPKSLLVADVYMLYRIRRLKGSFDEKVKKISDILRKPLSLEYLDQYAETMGLLEKSEKYRSDFRLGECISSAHDDLHPLSAALVQIMSALDTCFREHQKEWSLHSFIIYSFSHILPRDNDTEMARFNYIVQTNTHTGKSTVFDNSQLFQYPNEGNFAPSTFTPTQFLKGFDMDNRPIESDDCIMPLNHVNCRSEVDPRMLNQEWVKLILWGLEVTKATHNGTSGREIRANVYSSSVLVSNNNPFLKGMTKHIQSFSSRFQSSPPTDIPNVISPGMSEMNYKQKIKSSMKLLSVWSRLINVGALLKVSGAIVFDKSAVKKFYEALSNESENVYRQKMCKNPVEIGFKQPFPFCGRDIETQMLVAEVMQLMSMGMMFWSRHANKKIEGDAGLMQQYGRFVKEMYGQRDDGTVVVPISNEATLQACLMLSHTAVRSNHFMNGVIYEAVKAISQRNTNGADAASGSRTLGEVCCEEPDKAEKIENIFHIVYSKDDETKSSDGEDISRNEWNISGEASKYEVRGQFDTLLTEEQNKIWINAFQDNKVIKRVNPDFVNWMRDIKETQACKCTTQKLLEFAFRYMDMSPKCRFYIPNCCKCCHKDSLSLYKFPKRTTRVEYRYGDVACVQYNAAPVRIKSLLEPGMPEGYVVGRDADGMNIVRFPCRRGRQCPLISKRFSCESCTRLLSDAEIARVENKAAFFDVYAHRHQRKDAALFLCMRQKRAFQVPLRRQAACPSVPFDALHEQILNALFFERQSPSIKTFAVSRWEYGYNMRTLVPSTTSAVDCAYMEGVVHLGPIEDSRCRVSLKENGVCIALSLTSSKDLAAVYAFVIGMFDAEELQRFLLGGSGSHPIVQKVLQMSASRSLKLENGGNPLLKDYALIESVEKRRSERHDFQIACIEALRDSDPSKLPSFPSCFRKSDKDVSITADSTGVLYVNDVKTPFHCGEDFERTSRGRSFAFDAKETEFIVPLLMNKHLAKSFKSGDSDWPERRFLNNSITSPWDKSKRLKKLKACQRRNVSGTNMEDPGLSQAFLTDKMDSRFVAADTEATISLFEAMFPHGYSIRPFARGVFIVEHARLMLKPRLNCLVQADDSESESDSDSEADDSEAERDERRIPRRMNLR